MTIWKGQENRWLLANTFFTIFSCWGWLCFLILSKNEPRSCKIVLVKKCSYLPFFQYKYQLNIDGTVAAYRFPYLMLGDALVMKQESEYYEHFYRQLEPNKHYMPLKHDLSDVPEKVRWAKENDEKARKTGFFNCKHSFWTVFGWQQSRFCTWSGQTFNRFEAT